ncbi:MAG: hypothetical protein EOP45_12160, partial [Sphingobacteriaceae bacterium]
MCHRSVNERMMWVSIKIAGTVYRFISVYSPCDGANSDVMNDFYNDLNDIVYRKGNERVIVMGDLNARVGRNNPNFVNVLGKFGEDMVANGNGKRLLDFCQSSGLSITNSFFNHKKIHMYSWENPGQNRKSLLDYVIVEENLRNLVLDTRVYRSFGLDTDHYLVASKLRIKKGVPSNFQKPTNRVKVEKLKDENVASEFVSKLENKFTQIEMNEANDIEHEWSVFKKVILE